MLLLVVEQVVKETMVVNVGIFLVVIIQMEMVEEKVEHHHTIVDVDKQVEDVEDIMVVGKLTLVE